jgi:aminopeptidase N
VNDLVHTKLDVKFDWEKRYLYGKAWITLKPHFYDTDSLRLDAKGFDIHKIEMVGKKGNTPLTFTYDSLSVNIDLGRTWHAMRNIPFTWITPPGLMKLKCRVPKQSRMRGDSIL